ncbi:MAG TPA: S9 family peptidase, partial [Rhodothermales bacterium]|nr:S9 family peptidase [Rhodothermales bacterium]
MRTRSLVLLAALLAPVLVHAQNRPALTVAQIMQYGEEMRRRLPSPLGWDERGEFFYFNWNPGGAARADSLYRIPRNGTAPEKAPAAMRRNGVTLFSGWQHGEGVYDAGFRRKVVSRGGDVILVDRQTG